MGVPNKTIESEEYQNSSAAMKCIFTLLKQQLEIAVKLVDENNRIISNGREQYRTYYHNKRWDKIGTIPCNRVATYKLKTLIGEIDKFFAWEKRT